MLSTVVAIATVDKWGRKPLMLLGSAGMGVSLVLMGLIAQRISDPAAMGGWMLFLIILYVVAFGLSVGPVTWVILSEIFPTAVRGRALGLATFCLWMADYLVTQTFPIMDAPGSWFVTNFNHAFPFYTHAFFCLVLIIVLRASSRNQGQNPAGKIRTRLGPKLQKPKTWIILRIYVLAALSLSVSIRVNLVIHYASARQSLHSTCQTRKV
jgi:MFS family permease